MNTFRIMRADGIKPSIVVLNSLINAFGEDRRDTEAFAVLHFMKENVSLSLYPSMLLDILETAIKHFLRLLIVHILMASDRAVRPGSRLVLLFLICFIFLM